MPDYEVEETTTEYPRNTPEIDRPAARVARTPGVNQIRTARPPAPVEGTVQMLLNETDEMLMVLGKSLAELEGRLTPVLVVKEGEPMKPGNGAIPDNHKVGERIRMQRDVVRGFIGVIDEINQRLEV